MPMKDFSFKSTLAFSQKLAPPAARQELLLKSKTFSVMFLQD
jgi:hypothetical protein